VATEQRSRGTRSQRRTKRTGTSTAPGARPASAAIRFLLIFLLWVAAFALATSTGWAGRFLHEPLSRAVSVVSSLALAPLGEVSLDGTDLTYEGFVLRIAEPCNGVLPSYIYIAAVLAFPCRWRDRALGLLIGVPAIAVINIVRVVTLMMVGAAWPEHFDKVHIYVWQALVITLTLGLWVYWSEAFVRPPPRSDA
jgi:exosortase H (IPTLxxWG-CTERM-specific)